MHRGEGIFCPVKTKNVLSCGHESLSLPHAFNILLQNIQPRSQAMNIRILDVVFLSTSDRDPDEKIYSDNSAPSKLRPSPNRKR